MLSLQSNTMKILISILCLYYLLPVEAEHIDRYSRCESCLAAAQELEEAIKDTPPDSRQSVIEKLLSGQLCENLSYNEHVSKDKMKSTCRRLLNSHKEKFHVALVNEKQKNLSIVLCYEQSHACVGVKRQHFQDSKAIFTETDIDALLRDNQENVRVARPLHAGSPAHKRDEM
ncbi:uncharacterized protein FYW49_015286 [Xenentodon cancila]